MNAYKLTEEEELLCAKRVAKGAEFLDMQMSDWFLKIDTRVLDMTDGSCCIIGQLFGSFTDVIYKRFSWTEKDAADHGVLIEDGDDDQMFVDGPEWAALYNELEECWIGQIADRVNGVHGD